MKKLYFTLIFSALLLLTACSSNGGEAQTGSPAPAGTAAAAPSPTPGVSGNGTSEPAPVGAVQEDSSEAGSDSSPEEAPDAAPTETPAEVPVATPTATPSLAQAPVEEAPAMTAEEAKAAAEKLIGSSVDELYAAIGRPESFDYAPSCLGDGEDGNLYYNGFTVYTYRENDEESVEYVE